MICTLFFNSLLYNLTNPDDGTCESYDSRDDCLNDSSQYSSHDTKCYWGQSMDGNAEGQCSFKEPSSSANAMIFVAMVSALLSIPFVIIFEFIIMEILSRPTADPLASTHPLNVPEVPGETSVDDSEAEVNSDFKELLTGLCDLFHCSSVKEREELESICTD